jgi:hypothetical protein
MRKRLDARSRPIRLMRCQLVYEVSDAQRNKAVRGKIRS